MHSQRLRLPTPFSIGAVNCYLFDDGLLTLMDPGPDTEAAYESLVSGLEESGYTVDGIDRIILTHPHLDHYSMTGRLQAETAVSVFAHGDAVERLTNPTEYFRREREFFEPFLVSMGVPEDIVGDVVQLPEEYRGMRQPVHIDRPVHDGDSVDVGGGLTVVSTPGHSPGSACYLTANGRALYTGDHVMEEISPNPLLTLKVEQSGERERSLPAYLSSLEKVRSLGASVGYPGHRDTIPDLGRRISEIIEHHRNRKERIATVISEQGPVTPYQIMAELFPSIPTDEVFSGMSEVIGHLDLLTETSAVDYVNRDGKRFYRAE